MTRSSRLAALAALAMLASSALAEPPAGSGGGRGGPPGGGPGGGPGPLAGPVVGSGVAPAERTAIAWFGTWKGALAEAQRSGRPIMLLAAAPQCRGISGVW